MALEHVSRLARAVEDNWCAAWASLGQVPEEPQTLVDDTGKWLRVYTPHVPEMLLNTVLRYAGPSPVSAADVEEVVAPYRHYHLPFQWWMTAGEEPRGLRERLLALQMQSCGLTQAMALSLDGWTPPTGHPDMRPVRREQREQVSMWRVSAPEDAHAALQVICEVFYMSPGPMARWTSANPAFHLYLACVSGQPAAALALLPAGEVVGVYHVATRPGMRRRGLAGGLLALALSEARAAGARLATLTATPEARSLYESLGFRLCGYIEQWIPNPDLMTRLTHGGRGLTPRGGGWW